jgi:hypothetical protein
VTTFTRILNLGPVGEIEEVHLRPYFAGVHVWPIVNVVFVHRASLRCVPASLNSAPPLAVAEHAKRGRLRPHLGFIYPTLTFGGP